MVSLFRDLPFYIAAASIVLWVAGAIYFDLAGATWRGAALAGAWIGLALTAFILWQPAWQPFLLLVLLSALFLRWWFSQQPSHLRNWDPNFACLPRIAMEGDVITIEGVRNTEYLPHAESIPRFETRKYGLSKLSGADLLIVTWGSPWMCHPMFVFDFGADGRVCISIEVRYRVGQTYSLLRSLYRQQELMFVVSDERDAILRRTKWLAGHDLYLYRVHTDAVTLRRFFFEYANSINSLAAQPRWYHGFTTNCTTSIYAQGRGHIKWDWRILFNGALDHLMYDRQLLDQDCCFKTLKVRSRINDIANAAPADGFGDYVRQHLPGYCDQSNADCRNLETFARISRDGN
jgi:Domain of unknown function (DUF4105)